MKCLTRSQSAQRLHLQVLEQLPSPGPLHRHHLVRPWYPRVPREVFKCPSQFTCKCSRGTGSTPSGFCTVFLPIGCAARNQLPHDVEGKGSWILQYQEGQESRLFPFVDLNGGVLNFRCWIDKLSWALANQSPLPPRTLVEVCMKGPSLLGFFSFVLGSGRVRRPHIQGEKRVVVLVLTTCRWNMAGPDHMTALLLAGRYVFPVPRMWHRASNASSLARNSLLRW